MCHSSLGVQSHLQPAGTIDNTDSKHRARASHKSGAVQTVPAEG
jgi:hypothetical protein